MNFENKYSIFINCWSSQLQLKHSFSLIYISMAQNHETIHNKQRCFNGMSYYNLIVKSNDEVYKMKLRWIHTCKWNTDSCYQLLIILHQWFAITNLHQFSKWMFSHFMRKHLLYTYFTKQFQNVYLVHLNRHDIDRWGITLCGRLSWIQFYWKLNFKKWT